jgi:dTDP-4-dehydrorhamnose 3,5-epimerase
MKIEPTMLDGVFLLTSPVLEDERGWFVRAFCADSLRQAGLVGDVSQASLSFNRTKGTLRGMHYQAEPAGEVKIVRCTRGAVYDVVVDLRPGSSSHLAWVSATLSERNGQAFYLPPGCAHGFLTLEEDCQLLYAMDTPYAPELARGVRWNDPAFRIDWPTEPTVLSPRDRDYPDHVV